MKNKVNFTYWLEADGKYLGNLNDYPDHWTQGVSIEDLKDHLVLCQDKELNEMLFFFQISALKILAVATATPAFFALIFKKITAIII